MTGRLRVCVVSDVLAEPCDEGSRTLAKGLVDGLRECEDCDLTAIGAHPTQPPSPGAFWAPANRLLLSPRLRRHIRDCRPDVVMYVPGSSATAGAFVRSLVLRQTAPRAAHILVAFQPRRLGLCGRFWARRAKPDLALCLGPQTARPLVDAGIPVEGLVPGVDLARFKPPSDDERTQLRRRYDIPAAARVALHVGHMKRERNVHVLADVAQLPGWHALLVTSSSTQTDHELTEELRRRGVTVWPNGIDNIEDAYRLSDCYVFPVTNAMACAETPLSALEAAACGLPIVSTRFGALPEIFDTDPDMHFADDVRELVERIAGLSPQRSRHRSAALSWQTVGARVLDLARRAVMTRGAFICLTGIDGSGKTTQAKRLVSVLRARGHRARYVWCRGRPFVFLPIILLGRWLWRAPNPRRLGARSGERENGYQQSKGRAFKSRLLRAAWRWIALAERLVEARIKIRHNRRGEIVVCDRYVYDGVADLCVTLGQSVEDVLWRQNGRYDRALPKPDVTLMLDVDVETALARKDDIPSRSYIENRHGLYRDLAVRLNWTVIDATRPPVCVASAIDEAISKQLQPEPGA